MPRKADTPSTLANKQQERMYDLHDEKDHGVLYFLPDSAIYLRATVQSGEPCDLSSPTLGDKRGWNTPRITPAPPRPCSRPRSRRMVLPGAPGKI